MSSQVNFSQKTARSSQGRFGFWHKWLLVVVEFYILFGLLIVFLNRSVLFSYFDKQLSRIFWATAVPPGLPAYQSWFYGLLGSILIAWGINMFFITQNAFKRQEKWAWQALFFGLLAWYVIDSLFSLRYGVVFNAIINTVLFGLGMLPLIFTRKYFN